MAIILALVALLLRPQFNFLLIERKKRNRETTRFAFV